MSELRLLEHAYRGRMTSETSRPRRSMIFRVEHVLEVLRMGADILGRCDLAILDEGVSGVGRGSFNTVVVRDFYFINFSVFAKFRSFDTGYF